MTQVSIPVVQDYGYLHCGKVILYLIVGSRPLAYPVPVCHHLFMIDK